MESALQKMFAFFSKWAKLIKLKTITNIVSLLLCVFICYFFLSKKTCALGRNCIITLQHQLSIFMSLIVCQLQREFFSKRINCLSLSCFCKIYLTIHNMTTSHRQTAYWSWLQIKFVGIFDWIFIVKTLSLAYVPGKTFVIFNVKIRSRTKRNVNKNMLTFKVRIWHVELSIDLPGTL